MAIGFSASEDRINSLFARLGLWLTIAAFWELFLSIAVVGFSALSLYLGMTRGGIGPAIDYPDPISHVPFLISA